VLSLTFEEAQKRLVAFNEQRRWDKSFHRAFHSKKREKKRSRWARTRFPPFFCYVCLASRAHGTEGEIRTPPSVENHPLISSSYFQNRAMTLIE